ncbi:hypothetical protein OC834_001860 [Tilletia horrida]|nr:hypothetical protein OC834_001860 [Tilletia horrida]
MFKAAHARYAVATAAAAAAAAQTQLAAGGAAKAAAAALPIPSLAPKPPGRQTIKAASLRAARRRRADQQGFQVEGPKLTLLEQEKLLRQEIAELERKLESTTQAESSKQATEHLPPLDELTLEQLYHALTLPEPLTPAEERLLLLDQRRSVKRVLSLEAPASKEERPAPLLDRERVQLRLRALESRIAGIALTSDQELAQVFTDERDSLAVRVGQLISSHSEAETAEQAEGYAGLPGTGSAELRGEPVDRRTFHEIMSVCAHNGDVAQCQHALRQLEMAGLSADSQSYHYLVKAHLRAGNTLVAMQSVTALERSPTPALQSTYTLLIDHLINHPSASRAVQSAAWSIFYHMRLAVHPIPDAPLYSLMLHACAKGVPQPSDVLPIAKHTIPVVRAVRKMRKPGKPDAERALDLFREMTTTYKVKPNAEIYNNIILACCRSGEEQYYHEAFRLLREMLQKSDEAARLDESLAGVLWSFQGLEDDGDAAAAPRAGKFSTLRITPDRYTFHAFLHGCERHGDLARARWVLAEMIRAASYYQRALTHLGAERIQGFKEDDPLLVRLRELDECRPNAETLAHVLYAYASYQPPIWREQIKIVGAKSGKSKRGVKAAQQDEDTKEGTDGEDLGDVEARQASTPINEIEAVPNPDSAKTDINTIEDEAATAFTLDLPQTSADALREIRALMSRIVSDRELATTSDAGDMEGRQMSVLSTVQPSVPMLNAYMSAVLKHLDSKDRFDIFEEVLMPLPDADQAVIGEEGDASDASSTLEYGSKFPERSLYARLGLRPNSRTYQVGLNLCADVNFKLVNWPEGEATEDPPRFKGSEIRKVADRWWEEWRRLDAEEEAASKQRRVASGLEPDSFGTIALARRREKAWSARIRHLAKFHMLEEAVSTLHEFTQLYPPYKAGQVVLREEAEVELSKKARTAAKAAKDSKQVVPVEKANQPLPALRTKAASRQAAEMLSLPTSLLAGIGPLSIPPQAYNVLLATAQIQGATPPGSAEGEANVVDEKGDQQREQNVHSSSQNASNLSAHVTDAIRPGLTWTDLALLHQRLVERGGKAVQQGIRLVNWAGKAYEAQKKESW